jgi:type VI secretion system protein ImpF
MKLLPNLIERLISTADTKTAGEKLFLNVEQARESVAFDLEALLNSRAHFSTHLLSEFPLAAKSVLNFGIPDFSSISLLSGLDVDLLCCGIASAVERQDSRMRLVEVSIDSEQSVIGRLRFNITASLTLSGVEQPVGFSADFDQRIRRYLVGRRIT